MLPSPCKLTHPNHHPQSKDAHIAAMGWIVACIKQFGVTSMGMVAAKDVALDEYKKGKTELKDPKVSGWGAYCQASVGFLLLPVAPSVSCPSVDALQTRSSNLPLSPAVSRCLPLSPNVYNPSKFTPQPPS